MQSEVTTINKKKTIIIITETDDYASKLQAKKTSRSTLQRGDELSGINSNNNNNNGEIIFKKKLVYTKKNDMIVFRNVH